MPDIQNSMRGRRDVPPAVGRASTTTEAIWWPWRHSNVNLLLGLLCGGWNAIQKVALDEGAGCLGLHSYGEHLAAGAPRAGAARLGLGCADGAAGAAAQRPQGRVLRRVKRRTPLRGGRGGVGVGVVGIAWGGVVGAGQPVSQSGCTPSGLTDTFPRG